MKVLLISIGIILGILLLGEGSLRLFLGLGQRPLYIADLDIGYLLSPNQQIRRLGKEMTINQYSMRSQAIEKARSVDTLRIFLLGDSIANGAWWTDQQETISALMAQNLQEAFNQPIEILNASANSWGPRNQLAYLKRFGTFESQIIVLLMNTDDLFATAPTSLPVGKDRNYPDRQPSSAIGELLSRFFDRPQPIPGMAEVLGEKGDRVGVNLAAIDEMQAIASHAQSQFLVAITPLKREVETEPREYEQRARKRLQELSQSHRLHLIDFLPIFQEYPEPLTLYRDHIHLSPQGNQLVSDTLSQKIRVSF